VAVCAARGAGNGFGFARNTATTFDIFYWLQVKNFDVRLLNSAPNGPDYIDIVGLCLHAQLFRSKLLMNPISAVCKIFLLWLIRDFFGGTKNAVH